MEMCSKWYWGWRLLLRSFRARSWRVFIGAIDDEAVALAITRLQYCPGESLDVLEAVVAGCDRIIESCAGRFGKKVNKPG